MTLGETAVITVLASVVNPLGAFAGIALGYWIRSWKENLELARAEEEQKRTGQVLGEIKTMKANIETVVENTKQIAGAQAEVAHTGHVRKEVWEEKKELYYQLAAILHKLGLAESEVSRLSGLSKSDSRDRSIGTNKNNINALVTQYFDLVPKVDLFLDKAANEAARALFVGYRTPKGGETTVQMVSRVYYSVTDAARYDLGIQVKSSFEVREQAPSEPLSPPLSGSAPPNGTGTSGTA